MEVTAPRISGPSERLRVCIGEADKHQERDLWHAIILAAKREGLAGATVHRAIEGFRASTRIQTAGLLSSDLPVIVEIGRLHRLHRALPAEAVATLRARYGDA